MNDPREAYRFARAMIVLAVCSVVWWLTLGRHAFL